MKNLGQRVAGRVSSALERIRLQPSKGVLYQIRSGYRHREVNRFFDDTGLTDEYQLEVYEAARSFAKLQGVVSVLDVGCGSGYKLIKYFGGLETTGTDLPQTVAWLKSTYPERRWGVSELDAPPAIRSADLVICADVVEHIPDPDKLLNYLAQIEFKALFLSTPERVSMYGHDQDGPPRNRAHCREWTLAEFTAYVSQWFEVQSAYLSNKRQATQLAICSKK